MRDLVIQRIIGKQYEFSVIPTLSDLKKWRRPKLLKDRIERQEQWATGQISDNKVPLGFDLRQVSDEWLLDIYERRIRDEYRGRYTGRTYAFGQNKASARHYVDDRWVVEFEIYNKATNTSALPDMKAIIGKVSEFANSFRTRGLTFLEFDNEEDALMCMISFA